MKQNNSHEGLLKRVEELEAENNSLKKQLAKNTSQDDAELSSDQAFVKAIIDILPFVSWVKDTDNKFVYANYLLSRKLNKSLKDIVGKTDFDLYPKDLAQKYQTDEKRVIELKEAIEFNDERKDKVYKTIKAPVLSEKGDVVGTIGYQRDITLETEALSLLKRERDFLQFLLDNISYTIYFKDLNSCFTKVNQAQAILIGESSPEDLIGKTDFDYFSKEHAQNAMDDEKRIIKTGIPVIEKAEKLDNVKGGTIWVASSKYPIKDSSGKIIGLVGMSRDITIERMAEHRLKKAKEKAEESDQLKTAFLTNMSHEIRTPMNGIMGFANLLKTTELSEEEKKEYLTHIEDSGETLLQLIEDIIDIAKIEAGQIKIKPAECHLNEVMNDLLQSFENINTKENNDKVSLILEEGVKDKNVTVITDHVRLKQIINNLVGNAIKFTQEGSVTFGYKFLKDDVEFFVKDTGIGIPDNKINLIFERFGQVVDTNQINPKGTGLGLAISINMVRLLGGEMWVESEEGKGSDFYFTIPNILSVQDDSNEDVLSKIRWANKTILVAEDEDDNWLFIKEALKKSKAKLIRAKDGEEALDACKNNSNINLVLMDLKMPNMDGYEATMRIREFRENLPIIAQTAYNWPYIEEGDNGIKAGCDDFICKPLNKESLLKIIIPFLGD